MERWQPGEEPLIVLPESASRSGHEGVGVAAGDRRRAGQGRGKHRRQGRSQFRQPACQDAGRTSRPVRREARAKSEKCLTEAVYFEARGEAVRGQIAVAQVVMNRTFSGFYPNTVCGVVYQNKHRHMACQFTFACDNNPDVDQRARHVGARQEDRQGDARRPALAAGSRQIDPLSRLLGAPVLGRRDEEDVQIRRAYLLSAAGLGRRQRGAELGHSGRDRAKSPRNSRKPPKARPSRAQTVRR